MAATQDNTLVRLFALASPVRLDFGPNGDSLERRAAGREIRQDLPSKECISDIAYCTSMGNDFFSVDWSQPAATMVTL